MKFKHLVLTFAIASAYFMNPDIGDHKKQILEGQSNLDFEPNIDFIRKCDYYDYKLFSFMVYKESLVSIGIYNNVHIQYDELKYWMVSFQEGKSLSVNDPPQD